MFRMDMEHTQPSIPWVQGINGTRFEAGHSPHITSRLGRLGAAPLIAFYVFMRFMWTTVIIFIEKHVAFNYAVDCHDYIIIGSTDLGRPWPPQANVASDLYSGQPPANFYNPVSLRLPLAATII